MGIVLLRGLLGCVRAFCRAGRLLYRDKQLCQGRQLFGVLRYDVCEERVAAIELKNAKEGTGWGFDEYYVLTAGGAASERCD